MATFTETRTETFHVIGCASCGSNFGINDALYRRAARQAIGHIYCPSCGRQNHWSESDDKKRIRELEESLKRESAAKMRERQSHDQTKTELRETEARRRAEKAAKTRIKNRVANGVCPCCNRTFQDLHRHMTTKHPEYAKTDE